MLSLIQIVLVIFLFFALSRVVLRFKGGVVSLTGLMFWSSLFALAIVAVLIPDITSRIARAAGIGRGADAVIYASIVLLFYLIFRPHIFLEDIKSDITEIVRKLALKDIKSKNAKKTS